MDKKQQKKIQYGKVLKYFVLNYKKHPYFLITITIMMIVSNSIQVYATTYLKKFIDILNLASSADLYKSALYILLSYLVIKIIGTTLYRSASFINDLLALKSMKESREFAYTKLMSHNHSFFLNSFTGSLTQKVNKYQRAFEIIMDTIVLEIMPLLVWCTGALFVVYQYSHQVAFIIFLGVFGFFSFNFIFVKYKSKYDKVASESETFVSAQISDTISNQNTIMLFNGFNHEIRELGDRLKTHTRNKLNQWIRGESMYFFQALLLTTVEYFMLKHALIGWSAGTLTTGMIVIFQIYVIGLVQRMYNASQIFRKLSESFSDANEMVEIFEHPIEVLDSPDSKEIVIERGEVKFENVDFVYEKSENKILDNFTLDIKSGEKVAFVGRSGAGKSTLFKLLLRLYDTTNGDIKLDEYSIKDMTLHSLREALSYVPQEAILFHRSLADNIGYGNRDANKEEIIEASKKAQAYEFISKTNQGFDTLVGERGIKLSGGERQRIAIARAMIKNAPILLLDEATSSLDSHSENEIQKALEILMEGKTVLVIAHRLSTIKKMDRIVYLEDGKILEEGSHEELLKKKNGAYKKLWDMQVDGFIG